jgi:hypothetical protein
MSSTEPKVALQVLMQSQDAIRVTPFREGSALESTVKSSRICPFHSGLVADRSREVLALLARANAGETGLLPQLVAAGRSIWVDLLPAFLKQRSRRRVSATCCCTSTGSSSASPGSCSTTARSSSGGVSASGGS